MEEALASRRLSRDNNDPGTPRNARKIIYLFSMKTNRVDTFDEEKSACVPCPELASSDVGRDDNYRCAIIVQDELYVVSKMAVNRFNPVTRKWTWIGEGKVSVSALKPNTAMMAEQFSFECRKTKTKVITPANHKGRRQHNEPINTRSTPDWIKKSGVNFLSQSRGVGIENQLLCGSEIKTGSKVYSELV